MAELYFSYLITPHLVPRTLLDISHIRWQEIQPGRLRSRNDECSVVTFHSFFKIFLLYRKLGTCRFLIGQCTRAHTPDWLLVCLLSFIHIEHVRRSMAAGFGIHLGSTNFCLAVYKVCDHKIVLIDWRTIYQKVFDAL